MDPWQQTFYEDNKRELFALALAICRCESSAEDAVHNAFLRLWNRPKPNTNVRAYVYQTVRNAAIDINKEATCRREKTISLFQVDDVDLSPFQQEETPKEEVELVQQMINGLKQSDKEIVVLKVFAKMTFREVANVVEKPAKAVESQYRRALQELRRRYQPYP